MKSQIYFVWRLSEKEPFRAYGTHKHFLPNPNEGECIYQGPRYFEALQIARVKNSERSGKNAGQERLI